MATKVGGGHPSNEDSALAAFFGGGNEIGPNITPDTAMQISTVNACVNLGVKTISTVPLRVMRRLPDGGKEPAFDHPLYPLLHDAPNPIMSSTDWRAALQKSLELGGNAFSEIDWSPSGVIRALWILPTDRMRVVITPRRVDYWLEADTGPRFIPQRNMFHVRFGTDDGIMGTSLVRQARKTLGLTASVEEFGLRFFVSGANQSGFFQLPGKLKPDDKDAMVESIRQQYAGLAKAHTAGVLDGGVTWESLSVKPDEAQFLGTRQLQPTEIARFWGWPPHMVGDLSKATFSNISDQSINFVRHGVRPRIVNWEQAGKRSLFREDERSEFFIEFSLEGLLRGDLKARADGYSSGINAGWLMRNEARLLESLSKKDGLDDPLVPKNMGTVGDDPDESDRTLMQKVRDLLMRSKRISLPPIETRAANRNALRRAFQPIFERDLARFVRREVAELKKLVEKHLGTRSAESLAIALEAAQEEIFRLGVAGMEVTYAAYTKAIAESVAKSLGLELEDVAAIATAELNTWAGAHAGSSIAQLQKILRDGTPDDVAETMLGRMAEWTDKRAAKEAQQTVRQSDGSIARQIWIQGGVERIVWHTDGNPCPLCEQLEGETVGLEAGEAFLSEGQSLNAADKDGNPITDKEDPNFRDPIRAGSNVLHPPLHQGCNCFITTE